MQKLLRVRFWIGLAGLILLLPALSFAQETPTSTEILWDTWGVPHVFAPDHEGLFYGFGWAQAQNHGDLILELYGLSRGRGAEYWGEDYLDDDQLTHTLGVPQDAQDEYAALSEEWKGYLDAFTAGFNDYVDQHRDLIADEREAVWPVEPADVIGNGIRVLRWAFVAGRGVRIASQWAEDTDTGSGSNAWAIAPSRSASGNAMLVANPHQPWTGAGMWMEAHLVAPGVNVYGAALVGQPVLGIAFNDNLGWTHTVNTNDGWDLYELTLSDDGAGYLYDGETLPFETNEVTILVRQEDGAQEGSAQEEVPLTVRRSVHGPVLAQRGDTQAIAIRAVGEDTFAAGQQWWEMGLAQNFEEFQNVLRDIRIPMFTVMYADREGNIMHLFNQIVPRRDEGDWAFWSNITLLDDDNPAILPGDTSDYVWDEDDSLSYEELPKVINPESGWLQNANEPPWLTTFPYEIDPADYPAYVAPEPYIWPRPITSIRLLYEDESITFDELVEYKQSTFIELTNWVLDDLIAAARESDDATAQQAAEVLANWDRRADAESRGAVLFIAWANQHIEPLGFRAFETPWDINDPLNTPRGLGDPEGAVASLIEVASGLEALRALGVGMDVAYGDIFRVRAGEYDLPANGAEDLVGTFRTLTFAQDTDQRFRATSGDSYQAIIEFAADGPPRALVLLSHGNSTQPGSPHFGDQLELYAAQEFREAWRTREEIEANLEDRVTFEGR
jgi:acyl-homoserine-lactone acylase